MNHAHASCCAREPSARRPGHDEELPGLRLEPQTSGRYFSKNTGILNKSDKVASKNAYTYKHFLSLASQNLQAFLKDTSDI